MVGKVDVDQRVTAVDSVREQEKKKQGRERLREGKSQAYVDSDRGELRLSLSFAKGLTYFLFRFDLTYMRVTKQNYNKITLKNNTKP